MKRIWFTQQKPFNYMPLKAHLGMITENELYEYNLNRAKTVPADGRPFLNLCPKQLTTRNHKLKGKYYVVEGSRFAPYKIKPAIEFEAVLRGQLDLRTKSLDGSPLLFPDRFAQVDLGIADATFDDLVSTILKLNKKYTIDTPFFIHRLFPIGSEQELKEKQCPGLVTEPGERIRTMEQSQITNWAVV